MGKIVVGVDGSKASLRALDWAEREAALRDCSLVIVAAWEVPTMVLATSVEAPPPQFDIAEEAERHAEHVLADTAATAGVATRRIAVQGRPTPVLMHEAEGAELLVLGRSGHGEFTGMLLGSVALHAVCHAPCPVVIVRGDE